MATGGRPNPLRVPGSEGASNVFNFQYFDDAEAILDAMSRSKTAVVTGGSYIAYELAEGFREAGLEVFWLHRGPYFLRRALDPEGGALVDDIARDHGVALGHVSGQIQTFLDSESARPELAECRAVLAAALADLQAMVVTMTGYLIASQENARDLYRLGLESVTFLLAVGDLLFGWLLLWHAEIALEALDAAPSDRDRAFYAGKVATAKFFVKNVLPRLAADRRIVESVDLTAMDLSEEAF